VKRNITEEKEEGANVQIRNKRNSEMKKGRKEKKMVRKEKERE